MSSLIEWPIDIRKCYFLPGIVVVVLLLALLLLMSSRRRAAVEAARDATEPFDDEETPGVGDGDGDGDVTADVTADVPATRGRACVRPWRQRQP